MCGISNFAKYSTELRASCVSVQLNPLEHRLDFINGTPSEPLAKMGPREPSRAKRPAANGCRLLGCLLLLMVAQRSLLPADSTPGKSGTLDRLQMPPKGSGGAKSPNTLPDELQQRAAALCRLQAADEAWWDGVQVDVPWAAFSKGMARRRDTFLGVIIDCDEAENVLDSTFTIEHEEDEETAVCVDGRELAGLVGFGDHGAHLLIAEIDSEVDAAEQRAACAPAGPKPRGRPKGSKNKTKDGTAAAAARAEAEADGIDPLGGLCDELDDDGNGTKTTGAKLRQGWEYTEYTGSLTDPHLQPQRAWGGIKHPRLRRRSYDAAEGKLSVLETFDATFPPAAFEWMHRELIAYSLGDIESGGTRQPFDWKRRTGQPAPSLGELIAWYATTKVMLLARCPVLREYWDSDAEGYNETIAMLFSYHRWNGILSNIHFADRSRDFPLDDAGVPYEKCPADKRNWDIQGFMDLLLTAWSAAVDKTPTLSLDEQGYRTKSRRVPGKQRNVQKPARYFIKSFVVSASDHPIRGYVFNIQMYGGKGDGGDCADGAKVSYVIRCITPDMHHDNLTLVYDNYYGGETPLLKLAELGIESVCTVNKNAVSHAFEKRDTGEKYKSGAKAGETKLAAALLPGEFRTAVTTATVHDSRDGAARTIQARAAPQTVAAQHVPRCCSRDGALAG